MCALMDVWGYREGKERLGSRKTVHVWGGGCVVKADVGIQDIEKQGVDRAIFHAHRATVEVISMCRE